MYAFTVQDQVKFAIYQATSHGALCTHFSYIKPSFSSRIHSRTSTLSVNSRRTRVVPSAAWRSTDDAHQMFKVVAHMHPAGARAASHGCLKLVSPYPLNIAGPILLTCTLLVIPCPLPQDVPTWGSPMQACHSHCIDRNVALQYEQPPRSKMRTYRYYSNLLPGPVSLYFQLCRQHPSSAEHKLAKNVALVTRMA